jgi:hypothetical protein
MKRGLVLIALVLAAALAGCEDDGNKAGGADVAEADIAVPADFADEAEKSINATNYKAELDSLEKELDAAQ